MREVIQGIVLEIISGRDYKVLTDEYGEVMCSLSTKARNYLHYDILLGEKVQIELSPIDNGIGRIEPRGWERKHNTTYLSSIIAKEEAEKIVLAHFTKRLAVNFELKIQSDKTFEFEEGYVIWFNGKEENIVGVFPVIVKKKTGEIINLKTHGDAQEMIELYRSNKL